MVKCIENGKLLVTMTCCSRRPVMSIPSDTPLTEDRAHDYFCDMVLGIEYCEYTSFTYISPVLGQVT